MLEKNEILLVLIILFITFYFVIYWGSGGKKKASTLPQIKNYLLGVRILIIILSVVSVILWTFI